MSRDTKHTPGPWATNGLIVTAPVFPSMLVVCTVSTTAPSGNTRYDPETHGDELRANANLIATAPEMYDLLATIENDGGQVPDWLWDKIQECLARARGEQA